MFYMRVVGRGREDTPIRHPSTFKSRTIYSQPSYSLLHATVNYMQ